jgi:DNA-binding MarR family transcriptional regulator
MNELEETELQDNVVEMERLMVQLGWVLHRQQTQRLKSHNLTMPQFMLLRALQRLGDSCTMSELAEAAMQVSATVTGIMDRLEERELVGRRPNPADRRSYQVVLTPQGESLLADVDQDNRERIAAYLRTMPANGRAQLLQLLGGYLAALTQGDDAHV